MDIFLIIITLILAVVLLVSSVYLMIYFLDPAEKGFADSWWCKVLVLLILPLDVSNTASNGGLRIDILWQIIFLLVFIFIVAFFPTAMFYYESDDTESFCRRVCWTAKHMVFVFVIVGLILGLMFGLIAYTSIPVKAQICPVPQNFISSSDPSLTYNCTSSDVTLKISVSFPIYVMALMSWIGWWLLVIYGGIGLSAIPMDLINKFRFRPTPLTPTELANKKTALRRRAKELLQEGDRIKESQLGIEVESSWLKRRAQKNQQRKGENRLRAEVILLERDFEVFKQEEEFSKVNPLLYPFYLCLGVVLLIVSVLWLLQILLFLIIKNQYGVSASPFLNNVLVDLQQPGATWIGTTIYVLLTVYLLWACIKGNVKFGLRFFFCFQAHPMKKDDTPMHSMMFNVSLILICSVAVTLFAVNAFGMFTRTTDINNMFGIQVRYLEFFRYFYENQVFEIMLFSWTILVALYLSCFKCKDTPKPLGPTVSLRQDVDLEFQKEKMQFGAKAKDEDNRA